MTEGNLVSSGPGEATLLTTVVSLDPVYAYFDADEQIYLKYTAGGDKARIAGSIDRHIRMALANEEGYPARGTLDFLDNQLDSAHRHDSRPRGVPQHRRPADAGPLRAPAPGGHRHAITAC